ncbi:hypothetical protein D3C75_1154670 [compost metagenome]
MPFSGIRRPYKGKNFLQISPVDEIERDHALTPILEKSFQLSKPSFQCIFPLHELCVESRDTIHSLIDFQPDSPILIVEQFLILSSDFES